MPTQLFTPSLSFPRSGGGELSIRVGTSLPRGDSVKRAKPPAFIQVSNVVKVVLTAQEQSCNITKLLRHAPATRTLTHHTRMYIAPFISRQFRIRVCSENLCQ